MLQGIRALARGQARLPLQAQGQQKSLQAQQKRFMSGEDDGVHRVNWWDAPQNPNIWQKHQLAWWTIGFYSTVAWLVTGGKKEEAPKA